MIPTETLRQRARLIVDALKAAAQPETYTEILRAARAIMAVDKMLRQLWPDLEPGLRPETPAVTPEAPEVAARPLNRQQRRAQAARQKQTPPSRSREEGVMPLGLQA